MTAIRSRRRRNTVAALTSALVALGLVAVLSVVGVRTLADSTAGRQAEGQTTDIATQRLPFTSTALMGMVDDDGQLTSVIVMALEPDGVGGTMVSLAATADANGGGGGELAPLDAVLSVDGPDAFADATGALSGLSFDVIELVDRERLAALLDPLGTFDVDLPTSLRDASSGREWEGGDATLTAFGAATVVTATDPEIEDWYFEPDRAAVWRSAAAANGDGTGDVDPVGSDLDLPVPSTLDEFVGRLFSGEVTYRALGLTPLDADQIDDELPDQYRGLRGSGSVDGVVAHDRAEVLMVMGGIAPSRMGAPFSAPTFRIVSDFDDDELADEGFTSADVLLEAVRRVMFVQANVVSVADLGDSSVPDVTRMVVSDPTLLDDVEDEYGEVFGDTVVELAEVAIDGIDVEVTLGRPFLDNVPVADDADVAGSGDDE